MTKSRTALSLHAALIPFLAPAGANAQPVDPQAMIEAQQRELRASINPRCPTSTNPDEIVVCGRTNHERYRVPPQEVPGAIPNGDRSGGEQRAALNNDDRRCTTIGRDQQCNGGLNVLAIGGFIAQAVEAIIEPD